jgi:hypothetical protein
MTGQFGETTDKITAKQKESFYDKFDKKFDKSKKPFIPANGHAPWCNLFVGKADTGKSGIALSAIKYLKINKSQEVHLIDLDEGNQENLFEYWLGEYESGIIQYYNPSDDNWVVDKGKKGAHIDYDGVLEDLKEYALWLNQRWKDRNIQLVIFDGLSLIKNFVEYTRKNEKNMDVTGDVKFNFWRIRNIDFLEMLKLYKRLPVHKIFIGGDDFDTEKNLKQDGTQKALYVNTDSVVSQKYLFTKVSIGGKIKFKVEVKKARQNLNSQGATVEFAEVSENAPEGTPYKWEPEKVLDLNKPIRTEDKK